MDVTENGSILCFNKPANQFKPILIIIIYTIVLCLVFTYFGYYLGINNLLATFVDNESVTINSEAYNKPTNIKKSVLNNFSENYIPRCGVSIYLPQRQSDNYWELNDRQNDYSPFTGLVEAVNINLDDYFDEHKTSVTVFCAPNDNQFTTDSLMKMIEIKYESIQKENVVPNPRVITSKKETIYWDKEVYLIESEGGYGPPLSSYIFATPKFIYEVVINPKSQKKELLNNLDQILSNLKFDF